VASHSVRIKISAAKELEAAEPRTIRTRIVSRIQALARTPRPVGSQKLAGESERYRLRQGSYRIVGHRREVYR
jgi:mRNA-degrading endonuclease RelE of RelBE toxin-antitoxin system